jgi:hypothetical protein
MLITRGLTSKFTITRGLGSSFLHKVAKLIVRGFTSKLTITRGFGNKEINSPVFVTGVSCTINLSSVTVNTSIPQPTSIEIKAGGSFAVEKKTRNTRVLISGLHLFAKLNSVSIKIGKDDTLDIIKQINDILNIKKEVQVKNNERDDVEIIDIIKKIDNIFRIGSQEKENENKKEKEEISEILNYLENVSDIEDIDSLNKIIKKDNKQIMEENDIKEINDIFSIYEIL